MSKREESTNSTDPALNDVLITPELGRRPSREPDYAAENRALTALAGEMASNPKGVLQKVVEFAMELCHADSAGISILEPGGENGIFRWHAVAGAFVKNLNGTMPREASPCETVIARNAVLLFNKAEEFFPALRGVEPRIYENLLAPWTVNGEPSGTLWVIKHTPEGRFDAEDARLLGSFARLAGAAYQMTAALDAANTGQQRLEQQVEDRTRDLGHVNQTLRDRDFLIQSLIAHLPGGAAFVVDHDLRYVLAGGEALETAGIFAEDLIGRRLDEVLPSTLTAEYTPFYRQALSGTPFTREHEAHGRVYLSRGVPLRDQKGLVYAALAVSYDITERRRAEEALRESQARLRLALDIAELGTWTWDLRSGAGDLDARAAIIVGLSPGTVPDVAQAQIQSIHPDDLDRTQAEAAAGVASGDSFELNYRIVDPDGNVRYVTSHARVFADEAGNVRLVGTNRDVTAERLADIKLRASEARQSFLVRLNDALRPLADPIEIQREATRTLGEHLGLNRVFYTEIDGDDYLIGGQFTKAVPPMPPGRYPRAMYVSAWVNEAYRIGKAAIVEDVHTDDRFTPEEREACDALHVAGVVAVPLVKAGQAVAVLGIHMASPRHWTPEELALMEETAERTWAAVERARSETAMRESEARLRLIIESARDYAIFTCDADGIITDWYGGAELVFGYEEFEIRGQSIDTLFTPEDRAAGEPEKEKARARAEGSSPDVRWHVCKDGRRVFIDGRTIVLHDMDGRVRGFLKIGQDITDRKRSEAALRESEEGFRVFVQNVREYAFVRSDETGLVTSWNPGAERLFGYSDAEILGQSFRRLLIREDASAGVLERELETVRSTGRNRDQRLVARKDGSTFWADWVTEAIRDHTGAFSGTVKVLRDETERKEAEDRKQLLLGELNHRVKNTLASVQSIATQTLRGATSPSDFVTHFQERLQALARAHNLLTRSSWEGAAVADIVREQLAFDGETEQISYTGPSTYLEPQPSLALALVLHELGTNTRKYGALSVPEGRLGIEWRVVSQGEEHYLHINWSERQGPPVQAPQRSGFGTMLIENSLRGLKGETTLKFDREGLSCHIRLPLNSGIVAKCQ